ncbi:hypothetical protein GF312_07870 [Candidatus Poribacteria bacterium]|nr:hypothetical protein [Candidatus Poribacteria bacterium]
MKKMFFIILTLLICQFSVQADLMDYVSKKDDSFSWKITEKQALPNGAEKIEVEMVSQTWQDIEWKHRLRIVKPKEISNPSKASIYITGSGSGRQELFIAGTIASAIKAPVAVLHDVPFQPLFGGKNEDALIAYTFIKAMETGDMDWPLLFPMTKTAVRAMDTMQLLFRKEYEIGIDGFVLAGGSKRGWTTWLTAAVDKRVKGILPAVYDNLDLISQMKHQLEAWGKYSEQIRDYTKLDIPQRLKTNPELQELSRLVDPYTYLDRVTMPKVIVIGTNDRYWPLDALNLYYDDLKGESYILYVPNKGHGVDDIDRIVGGWIAFFKKVDGKIKFPDLKWNYDENPSGLELYIESDIMPESISVWTSKSDTRDFREVKWQRTEIEPKGSIYSYTLETPEEGYAAIFGEAVYKADGKEYYLSTNVRILKAE